MASLFISHSSHDREAAARVAQRLRTVFGERDATIAATEQRAGAVLQAMITDESLTVSEAVQWCAGAATAELPGLVS